MTDSQYIQRQQKTSKEASNAKDRVEPESIHRMPSITVPSTKEASIVVLENLMEEILSRENMILALKRVEKNKGSHGIDRMKVEELRPYLKQNWLTIKESILEGKYKPSAVRRVEIPKPDGGVRTLGIPTVLDRLIQQAIAQYSVEVLLTNILTQYHTKAYQLGI